MTKHALYIAISYLIAGTVFLLGHTTATPGYACDKARDNSCGQTQKTEEPYLIKEFILDEPGFLKISAVMGNVEVIGVENSNRVKIELYVNRGYRLWSSSKNLNNYYINIERQGNKITAVAEPKEQTSHFSSRDQLQFSFKVYVPDSMSSEIKLEMGDVSLKSLKGDQQVRLTMGELKVEQIHGQTRLYVVNGNISIWQGEGKIMAMSKNGNIDVHNTTGEVRVRATTGNISGQQIKGAFLAKSVTGNIDARFMEVSDGIIMETKIGNVTAAFPDATPLNVFLKGSSLKLQQQDHFTGDIDGNSAQGILFGGGTTINLTSNFGTVHVKFYEH